MERQVGRALNRTTFDNDDNPKKRERMFALIWTNGGQHGIINTDSFLKLMIHYGEKTLMFFGLSVGV